MLIRTLIVLLIVLNLGAAAWWVTRPSPSPPPPPAAPEDVARLQLLSEGAPIASTPAAVAPAEASPAPAAAVAPLPAPTSTPAQCFSLGPFADAAAAGAASARLGAQATRSRVREAAGKGASAYNVYLPPHPDRAAAQATALRIGAAGFSDYLVISNGDLANGIALGRYRSRDSAERHQSALQAAGFPALLQVIGEEGASQWWLEVAGAPGVQGPRLQASAGATQGRALDCATLR